jgi:4-amino-4-deoxy-L-arabinose transferase-like glycosyltransferase
VFSVLSLPLAWLVGRRRGGVTVAWLAVLVLAASPFALRYATEARMYSLVVALTLLGWLALDHALEDPRPLPLAGVTLVSGALLLTHYWSFWLLGAVGIVLLVRWWRHDGADRTASWRAAAAVAAGGVFFLPWLPSFLEQASSTGTPWAEPSRPTAILGATMLDLGGGRELAEATMYAVAVGVLVLLGLLGRAVDDDHVDLDLRVRPEQRGPGAVIALTLLIGTVAGYATSSAFAGRYASMFFAPIVLLMAAGLSQLRRPVMLAGAVAVLLVLSAAGASEVLLTDRTQAEEIAAPINAAAAPGDLVVFCPDQLGPAGARALTVDVDAVSYPRLEDPRFVDWVDYEERNRASDPVAFAESVLDRAGSGTIWLVSSDQYRTLEGKCAAVQTELRRARPRGGLVVGDNGAEFFEHAGLHRFDPS